MLGLLLILLTFCDIILFKGGYYMFAEKLKKLRTAKGLTQVQFSKEFNISSGTIAMWETGKRMPDTDMLKRIANYFDVSIDYLLDNKKSPQSNEGELNEVYLSYAKEMQENDIDPEDIALAIETIKNMKRKKGGE